MKKQNWRVLFIGPKTFGYEKEIQLELRRLGYAVDWYDDRPGSTPLVKALIRTQPALLAPLSDIYFDGILKETRVITYDIVFVIKGEGLSFERLEKLRESQRHARFIYYTWDALSNFKNGRKKLSLFDKAYSFDRFDCSAGTKVKHLPLFYTRAYEWRGDSSVYNTQVQDIDLLFLGTLHSDRYMVTHNIWEASRNAIRDTNLYSHFYYQSRWIFFLRRRMSHQLGRIPWHEVQWKALDTEAVLSLIGRSKILIDVHHPMQTGLTMRTIEAVGAQKKLVTTNPDVTMYDFFQPENILVVDRNDPVVPAGFLKEPYRVLDEKIYSRYSLREWLREIFSD